jgi:hypothetical protein
METKKSSSSFVLIIVAIIVGVALFRQFDFQTLTLAKPALGLVYLITFVVCVSIILKNAIKNSKNK